MTKLSEETRRLLYEPRTDVYVHADESIGDLAAIADPEEIKRALESSGLTPGQTGGLGIYFTNEELEKFFGKEVQGYRSLFAPNGSMHYNKGREKFVNSVPPQLHWKSQNIIFLSTHGYEDPASPEVIADLRMELAANLHAVVWHHEAVAAQEKREQIGMYVAWTIVGLVAGQATGYYRRLDEQGHIPWQLTAAGLSRLNPGPTIEVTEPETASGA
jgi:hypothetical protein